MKEAEMKKIPVPIEIPHMFPDVPTFAPSAEFIIENESPKTIGSYPEVPKVGSDERVQPSAPPPAPTVQSPSYDVSPSYHLSPSYELSPSSHLPEPPSYNDAIGYSSVPPNFILSNQFPEINRATKPSQLITPEINRENKPTEQFYRQGISAYKIFVFELIVEKKCKSTK